MTYKFIKPTKDCTFRYLIKNDDFKNWFSLILEEKCGIDLKQYEYIDTNLTEGEYTKEYQLDNLLKDTQNNYLIIEMQRTKSDNKNLGYLFRIAGNNLNKGEYYKTSNVILFQIDDYIPHKTKKQLLHFTLKEDDNKIIKKGIEMYELVLPNYQNKYYLEFYSKMIKKPVVTGFFWWYVPCVIFNILKFF